eukprot:CAMPEP_0197641154 /NCGR_PEP_ID=MMETSP1338-20131121/15196_1 /TAXON_ID=43686 ORGANISM="Pelagodinium beii, Strain RCC1491" /NCGR_SAMPLE_ID=MMETSP1338 /ASSEMBLY_ACC=CAM_ASM_000754 /LENGTH=126 /DNA_ID=CAMNT_0043214083 /DNA_START=92 /DNA_END=472 /DNA_ORIENTATION=+
MRHVSLAALFQRVWKVTAVQVMTNCPGLAVSLLEVPQVRWLQEAVVDSHTHQGHKEYTVQEERTCFRFKHALDEAVDRPREDELDLTPHHGSIQVGKEKRRSSHDSAAASEVAGDEAVLLGLCQHL